MVTTIERGVHGVHYDNEQKECGYNKTGGGGARAATQVLKTTSKDCSTSADSSGSVSSSGDVSSLVKIQALGRGG